ncbi:MAG: lipid A biosynthesis acyltransferase [Betaproteobacteria bacterium]|nr:lipid A biosynthesis acyltransferase [Betaproteobacteria bacterium]MDH3435488.1 lipid A biosynthesis acyltransferase [Betaproteobacteria bacterium]
MSAAWLAEPERGSPAAIGLITWLTRALGRAATRWLLYPICLYFFAFSPRSRRASRAYLARALGREPHSSDVLRHYHAFAATVHDRVFLVRGQYEPFDIVVNGAGDVDRLLAMGRGCILLGSHLGSFEVLRALSRFYTHYAVNVVMHEANAGKTGRALANLAPDLRERVIDPGRPDAILRVRECLEHGEIVGILGDRPYRGSRTRPCSFLGATARFPLGPLLLAGALGAPVVMFFGLYRGGARYELHLETLTEGALVSREARSATAERLLERYVARLEHHTRQAPYNWFNFYDFWDEDEGAR